MDIKLMITAIGIIFAAALMYGQYARISKTPGMTSLSRATLAFRLVISVLSIGLSIYGVFNFTYDFLLTNGANKVVAVSVATTLAVGIASGLEFLLVNSEKAVYESWFYSFRMFLFTVAVITIGQGINYFTMKANANALFTKLFKQESKIVDSMVLDTARFVIDEKKKSIDSLRKELAGVRVDSESLYKSSRGYAKYNRGLRAAQRRANSKKLKDLAAKGNKWAKEQIAKHNATAGRYRAKLKALKAKAESKAKELLALKRAKIQERIDKTLNATVALSTDTVNTRDKKLAEVRDRASKQSGHFESLALMIVFVSVFLSIVHSMTSDTTLLMAKENALRQLAKSVEMKEKMNALHYQNAISEQNFDFSTMGENRSSTSRPNLDQDWSEKSTKEEVESVSSFGLSAEPKEEVESVDLNEKLWSIATGASIESVHPNRRSMKDLASGYGLDVSNWTQKYKEYIAAMSNKGRIKPEGKGYLIVGEADEVAKVS